MRQLFVCGHPKSGTTLLTALLDGHPDLSVLPEETQIFREPFASGDLGSAGKLQALFTRTPVELMGRSLPVDAYEGNRDYTSLDFERLCEAVTTRFDGTDGSDKALLDALMAGFAEVSGQTGRHYWVEKTPRTEAHLTKVFGWYPEARALYVVRDPRDVFVSYAKEGRRPEIPLGRFIRLWARSLAEWQRHEARETTLLVRYEDLVIDPRHVMERVCGWLCIPFDDALLTPTKLGVLWRGNSKHGDRFTGVSAKAVGRWRTLLSSRDLAAIESLLGWEMRRLGYDLAARRGVGRAARALVRCGDQRSNVVRALVSLYRPLSAHTSLAP